MEGYKALPALKVLVVLLAQQVIMDRQATKALQVITDRQAAKALQVIMDRQATKALQVITDRQAAKALQAGKARLESLERRQIQVLQAQQDIQVR
jgi:hypothetical protein